MVTGDSFLALLLTSGEGGSPRWTGWRRWIRGVMVSAQLGRNGYTVIERSIYRTIALVGIFWVTRLVIAARGAC